MLDEGGAYARHMRHDRPREVHSGKEKPGCWLSRRPAPYQNLEQLLQVAGDEGVVLVQRPAALLRIVPVTGEIAENHLQPLLVVAHLTLGQRRAQILQRRKNKA